MAYRKASSQSEKKLARLAANQMKKSTNKLNRDARETQTMNRPGQFIAKGVRGYSFQFFPLHSRIYKYEFPKRSLYLYWDNFKQSVGLQGFYQFY